MDFNWFSLESLFLFREVWQTEKTFGHEDIGAEEEFNLLREIYMTTTMDSKEIFLANFVFVDYLDLLPKNDEEEDEDNEGDGERFEEGMKLTFFD